MNRIYKKPTAFLIELDIKSIIMVSACTADNNDLIDSPCIDDSGEDIENISLYE